MCSFQEFKRKSNLTVIASDKFYDLSESVEKIANWQDLCGNLRVDETVMNKAKNDKDHAKYMCLKAFFDSEGSWEELVIAVSRPPFKDKRLAKDIAQTYVHESNVESILEMVEICCST